jgi:hypothetical protein
MDFMLDYGPKEPGNTLPNCGGLSKKIHSVSPCLNLATLPLQYTLIKGYINIRLLPDISITDQLIIKTLAKPMPIQTKHLPNRRRRRRRIRMQLLIQIPQLLQNLPQPMVYSIQLPEHRRRLTNPRPDRVLQRDEIGLDVLNHEGFNLSEFGDGWVIKTGTVGTELFDGTGGVDCGELPLEDVG